MFSGMGSPGGYLVASSLLPSTSFVDDVFSYFLEQYNQGFAAYLGGSYSPVPMSLFVRWESREMVSLQARTVQWSVTMCRL